MNLVQRWRDWQHERRIQALGDACRLACRLGSKDVARGLWDDMGEAINARSPEQVTRMEERMGLITKGPAADKNAARRVVTVTTDAPQTAPQSHSNERPSSR